MSVVSSKTFQHMLLTHSEILIPLGVLLFTPYGAMIS